MGSTEDTEKKRGVFGWTPKRLHIFEGIGALTGLFAVGFGNKASGKIFYSGIHKHIIGTLLGGYGGNYLYKVKQKYNRGQQLLVEDYMRLHPEEFASPAQKLTYGDMMRPWFPTR